MASLSAIDAPDEGLCMMLKRPLMKCVGYDRYVWQADETGSPMSSAIPRHAPAGSLGLAINLPATVAANASGAVSQALLATSCSPFERAQGGLPGPPFLFKRSPQCPKSMRCAAVCCLAVRR